MYKQNINFLLKIKPRYLYKFFGYKMRPPSGERLRGEKLKRPVDLKK